MSRKRISLKIKNRRAKVLYPLYQASEHEILSDLRQLKYVAKKVQIVIQQKVSNQETKKPKEKEGNDQNAIEMLTRLQTLQEIKQKKKIEIKTEAKSEKPAEKGNCYFGHIENPWMNFDYQNYVSNMVYMPNQGFEYYPMNLGYQPNPMIQGFYGFY